MIRYHSAVIKFNFFISTIVYMMLVGCDQAGIGSFEASGNGPDSFENMTLSFKSPPVEYSTNPFWVWNDKVTRQKIDFQLSEFKDKGIFMVIIHPRPGLMTEYLSSEWHELIEYAVSKAKELNMKIWLYDENSYPSGFAGGYIPILMPESYNQGVGLRLDKLDLVTQADSGKYFLLFKKVNDRFANITNGIYHYYNQPGEYYAFGKWFYPKGEGQFGGESYVDLLVPGTTRKFIGTTMRDYENYLAADLGNFVPGIFTDEPHISVGGENVIKWTPTLFDEFEKRYGYQLQTYLPCLFEETGDWKNVRHDYYSLLLDLFIEWWAKPWYEYTESKNLTWTGHYWEHTWPDPSLGPDNMAMYAWHQVPGIDMLFNDPEKRPDQFGNVRAVKELSSVANQLGKERALSETYGGSGWELNFFDMKRNGDWEYALGVNMMNQHLSYMTIKGARKRDFPPSFSYHAPYWEDYAILNQYFHRLSYVLSSGDQINRILVLEPTTTAWMYSSPHSNEGTDSYQTISKIKNGFHAFLDQLESFEVEYDLGSENIIREHGGVVNNQLKVGNRMYELVVLPPGFENFESSTFELVKEYIRNGGTVISFSEYIQYLDGNLSRKLKDFIQNHTSSWISMEKLDKETISAYFMTDGFRPLEVEKWGAQVYHHRRKLSDSDIIFLSNYDNSREAEVGFETIGSVALQMDPVTGDVFTLPSVITKFGQQVFLTIPPAGSALIVVTDKKYDSPTRAIMKMNQPVAIQTQPMQISRETFNVLPLDYCDLSVDGKTYNDLYFYNAADTVYKTYLHDIYGFNYNPWSIGVQYRTRILDKNDFPPSSGFTTTYQFQVGENFKADSLLAAIESADLYAVYINNHLISPLPERWWLDQDIRVFSLGEFIKKGLNQMKLVTSPMHILAEIEPIYILGDFNLSPADRGWQIISKDKLKTGSWKDQGLPFYPGKISYSKSFMLDELTGDYKVEIGNWQGSVMEIHVNGRKTGIVGWPPYQQDITQYINKGENLVEVKIVGSLKNLLGPHHSGTGKGFVTPWSFFYAPLSQPAGLDYDVLGYGLMDDFTILNY